LKKIALLLALISLLGMLSAEVRQSLVGADSLSIGTQFSFVIETDFPLESVQIPDSLSSFRVLDTRIRQQESGSIAELSIVPLRVGAITFPKLDLRARGLFRSGGSTDAFRVYVLATRADADSLLRDIKPPARYPAQFPFWLYLFVFLTSLVLATLLVIMMLSRKKPIVEEPPKLKPAPQKLTPPYIKALKRLYDLQQSGLAQSDILSYHYQLSMILREFLEHRYHFNAMEMTTSEIADSLKLLAPPLTQDFLSILRYCDKVKFAKLIPEIEELKLQTQALRLCLMQYAKEDDD
jgi:hypothetical protein